MVRVYFATLLFGLFVFVVGLWLQRREYKRRPCKWAIEMAKVTGLGVNATPEETADQYAELFNAYQELKASAPLSTPGGAEGSKE